MSEKTKISWCESTVNFWSGCTKVSPGCANCYAETLSNRNQGPIGKWGKGAPRNVHVSAFALAHRLNKKPWVCDDCGKGFSTPQPHFCRRDEATFTVEESGWHRRRIFSLSLGDWLDQEVHIEWLARMLDTIRQCTEVRWLLLTKRPELWHKRITGCLGWLEEQDCKWPADGCSSLQLRNWLADWYLLGKPPSNVLIGTSVEDQERDHRVADLLRIPASGRFLSIEPLLGPVDLSRFSSTHMTGAFRDNIHWIIAGGESGPKARPCNVEWIRSLARQGREAGVATFVKQLGAFPIVGPCQPDGALSYSRLPLKDPKGGDPDEWPEHLRVREFPEALL